MTDDEDDNGRHASTVDIIIRTPDASFVSYNEDLDDDIQVLNDVNVLPREIAGHFEIEHIYDDGNEHVPAAAYEEEVQTSGRRRAEAESYEYETEEEFEPSTSCLTMR